MADELSRDTVLWGLSYEGGKIPNKHTGIIQNTTYFFSSDTILKYNLKKNRFPYYLLILLAFSSLKQHSAVITLDSWQPMVGVGPWWKMIGYARSIHIYRWSEIIILILINSKPQKDDNITHSKETFISVTPMYNEGFDIVVCFGTGKMV